MTENNSTHTHHTRARWIDHGFTIGAWILGLFGFSLPLLIIGFLALRGFSVISWEFLSQKPSGFPLGLAGGILPAILGSLSLVGIGLLVALPTGVGGAVYINEYNSIPWISRTVKFAAECLAGIPSIVYGLFGYSFLVVFMAMNISLMAGGITLGFVMFPLILIGAQEALSTVDDRYREAALSLGATRSYVIRRIILPKAIPGILAVTILAAGHAIGSAAPVLYTASVIFVPGDLNLDSPVMTLPTHLYYLVGQAVSFEHAYGTALVLVSGLLLVNFLAMYLKSLARRKGV